MATSGLVWSPSGAPHLISPAMRTCINPTLTMAGRPIHVRERDQGGTRCWTLDDDHCSKKKKQVHLATNLITHHHLLTVRILINPKMSSASCSHPRNWPHCLAVGQGREHPWRRISWSWDAVLMTLRPRTRTLTTTLASCILANSPRQSVTYWTTMAPVTALYHCPATTPISTLFDLSDLEMPAAARHGNMARRGYIWAVCTG